MTSRVKRAALGAASALLLALVSIIWAAPPKGAAHLLWRETVGTSRDGQELTIRDDARGRERAASRERTASPERAASRARLPRAVRLRASSGRGLVVNAWVNGSGPYSFAVDTGAGATIISERVARDARVALLGGRATVMSGMSGAAGAASREASVRSLAIGDETNLLPSTGAVVVTGALPADVDGVLDPTEAFWPLGYSIDMPRGEISAFDPRTTPLRAGDAPSGGTVVPWLFERGSRRPFVMLDGGRRALLDTGSEFGLAVSETAARAIGVSPGVGRDRDGVRDIAGGRIRARRVAPATVRIGSLVLRSVPTDVLSGVVDGSPILLGRDALQPFYLSFDPLNKLILITP
jgi:predicted aspartyl protease